MSSLTPLLAALQAFVAHAVSFPHLKSLTPAWDSVAGNWSRVERNLTQSHPEAGFRNATRRRTTNENSTAIFILRLVVMRLLTG